MGATVDLHLHTRASDGRLSPTELVDLVAARGIKVAAISDHDTTEGLAEAYRAMASHPGLELIPAIELSADTDTPSEEAHILGYYLQYEDREFQDILGSFRMGRLERGRAMVERLGELGLAVEWERVQEIAGEGAVGRPHIALALVEVGYFKEPKDAFKEYLGNGGLAYVERRKMTPEQAVAMLAKVGAPAVLAHPYTLTGPEELELRIAELKAVGLAGMEVHYVEYNREQVAHLREVARRLDLIPCGGSDYHALGNSGERLPGTDGPPMESVERLAELAGKLAAARAG